MTPAELLSYADLIGCPVHLKPDGTPAVGGKPNAVLLASLRTHRLEIIRILGGQQPVALATCEPEYCQQCTAWVFEAEDSDGFCRERRCQFRRQIRYEEGPF